MCTFTPVVSLTQWSTLRLCNTMAMTLLSLCVCGLCTISGCDQDGDGDWQRNAGQ